MKYLKEYDKISDRMIAIHDDVAAMLQIEDAVKFARYHVRDEANRVTWVHDRLQGFMKE